MIIVGIDPGASGGVGRVGDLGPNVAKMPETEADLYQLLQDFTLQLEKGQDLVYLEKVHSMPRQGVSSTFKFGTNYGLLRGMLIAMEVPFETVRPETWQKALGCLSHGDKNVTKRRAQELFPELAKELTHATADALLIAEYGRRLRSGELVKYESK